MSDEQDERYFGSGLFWREMPKGAMFRTPARTMLSSETRACVNLSGMVEPLFIDRDRVGSTLQGDVCPGANLLSVAEGLVLNATVRDTGLALMGLLCRFRAPVCAGDTIRVLIEVTGSRSAKKGYRGLVETRNTVRKGGAVVVLDYRATRLVSGRQGSVTCVQAS